MSQPKPDNGHPYSKVIAVSSWLGATLGAILGICILVFLFNNVETRKEMKAAFAAPLLLGGTGYLFGMATAFMFASSSFLLGSSGKKWMEMVGTKTVGSARVVCAVFSLLAIGLFSVLVWAALTGNF